VEKLEAIRRRIAAGWPAGALAKWTDASQGLARYKNYINETICNSRFYKRHFPLAAGLPLFSPHSLSRVLREQQQYHTRFLYLSYR
jgi:hypothetical protein